MKITIKIALLINTLLIAGCSPEEFGDGNGLVESPLDAAFTIVPDQTSLNRFILKANANNYHTSKWDIGDGAGIFVGDINESIFLPDAGVYTITHYAVGKGGIIASSSIPLTVASSDPNSGNIVVGGKFETEEDIDKWTILTISPAGTSWSFENGKAKVSGGGWNQQGVFQAIPVIEGKTYSIDMIASSTSGVSNTWFEVYCSTVEPTQNSDYNADGMKRAINTWDGCGNNPFLGKISVIGCKPSNNVGTFTATITGTMYLVIKCGGENLKDGISIDNVEVRGV